MLGDIFYMNKIIAKEKAAEIQQTLPNRKCKVYTTSALAQKSGE